MKGSVWTQWGKQRVGGTERAALKHVHHMYDVLMAASGELLCDTGGAPSAPRPPGLGCGWERGLRGRGYTFTYCHSVIC